jgi:preprotein translocase subunit SecD
VSPARTTTSRRARRGLWISLLVTIAVAIGSLGISLAAGWSPKLGLDLAGGFSVVYQPQGHPSQADLNETVTILTDRVDSLGVSGAEVNTQGPNIVVTVPGVKNAQAVLRQVGETAQLFFRPVICYAPPFIGSKSKYAAPASTPIPSTCQSKYVLNTTNLANNTAQADPALTVYHSTKSADDAKNSYVLLPGLPGQSKLRYLLGPAQLTGRAVGSAYATENQAGQWVVDYTLTSSGSAEWDAVAEKNFHLAIAVDLDGVVQSAPIIQPSQSTFTSFDGNGEISGNMTQAQAQNLAQALEFGALPVRLVPLTTETVSPTLGHSSLVAGLVAGLVGLALVLLYVILYYRALGLVVVSGLALTAALLWAIISGLGHTTLAPSFTLAGVTGLIVSIGITVDSYIVYFERLKDETRSGRSVRTSVDRGFQSAWKTVLAADFVSLLAAVILYLIALGDVRGFAFFLGLSTILDVVMTYFFTRPAVILLGRSERASHAQHMGVARGLAVSEGDASGEISLDQDEADDEGGGDPGAPGRSDDELEPA